MTSRFTPEEKNFLRLAAEALSEYSDECSNHSCNDHYLPVTKENVELVRKMHEWNGDPENFEPPKAKDQETFVPDFFLYSFLAHLIRNLAKEGEALPMTDKSVVEADEGEG